jgi:hypothetical protein
MTRHYVRVGSGLAIVGLLLALIAASTGVGRVWAESVWQTTPSGPVITAGAEGATVRGGPGSDYDRVGFLVPGQVSQVVGKFIIEGEEPQIWFQIVYIGGQDNLGWVWAGSLLVGFDPNTIPDSIVPPTPTLPPTTTAEFGADVATQDPDAQRPPTFTPPGAILRPTLLPIQGTASSPGGVPPAIIILVLFVVGVLTGLISFLQGRR